MTHTFLRARKWFAVFHLISCFPPPLISDQVQAVGSVACALPKVILSRRRRVVGQKKKTRFCISQDSGHMLYVSNIGSVHFLGRSSAALPRNSSVDMGCIRRKFFW